MAIRLNTKSPKLFRDNGKMTFKMDRGVSSFLMAKFTLVIFLKVKDVAMASASSPVEAFTKVIGRVEWFMEKARCYGPMDVFIKDYGTVAWYMAKENFTLKIAAYIKVFIIKIKKMDKDY